MKLSLISVPNDEFEDAVALVLTHPVMKKNKVIDADQRSVIKLLQKNKCPNVASVIKDFTLDEFEDFIVNECGEE